MSQTPVGALIIKDKRILATGYNGAPSDVSTAPKQAAPRQNGNPVRQRHELCRAIHAEQNALVQAAYSGTSVNGGTLYVTHQPCVLCAKWQSMQALKIVFKGDYPDDLAMELLQEAGVRVVRV